MNAAPWTFAFLAGLLTTLSPCVLPVLPLVLGSTLKAGKRGPLFFGGGLLFTFITVTWIVAGFGDFLGLSPSTLRTFSALLLSGAGLLYLSASLQEKFTSALAPLLRKAESSTRRLDTVGESASVQLLLGALTGVLWTPCSGPSLGFAAGLVAAGENHHEALLIFLFFGIGALLPLLLIAYTSQAFSRRLIRKTGTSLGIFKKFLGAFLLFLGLSVLFGWDKNLEAFLVRHSPDWLTELTTRY